MMWSQLHTYKLYTVAFIYLLLPLPWNNTIQIFSWQTNKLINNLPSNNELSQWTSCFLIIDRWAGFKIFFSFPLIMIKNIHDENAWSREFCHLIEIIFLSLNFLVCSILIERNWNYRFIIYFKFTKFTVETFDFEIWTTRRQ